MAPDTVPADTGFRLEEATIAEMHAAISAGQVTLRPDRGALHRPRPGDQRPGQPFS